MSAPASRRDLLLLALLGLLIAMPWRGHFIKPHNDFYEFCDTGRALLHGQWPESFKRAPLYPLLVGVGGALLGAALPLEAPELVAAEWLNALLLPISLNLIYLVGRRWFGESARWVAVVFAFTPIGVYCTSHALVEPLLTALILLTIYFAQRRSILAYLVAALAAASRYDAAGAIFAVVLADIVSGRRRRAALGGFLALLPLALWLSLTMWRWQRGQTDHYLEQMAAEPAFHPLWALTIPLRCLFNAGELRVPDSAAWLRTLIDLFWPWVVGVLALCGAAGQLRHRGRGMLVAAVIFLGYAGVHAVFPFREIRFGYPVAPLVLLAAGVGAAGWARRLASRPQAPQLARVLLALAAACTGLLLLGEVLTLPLLPALPAVQEASLSVLALLGLVLLWSCGQGCGVAGAARVVLLMVLVVLARVQVRATVSLMGNGREMINVVEAARWVRDHTPTQAGVLGAEPGILRLLAPSAQAARFVGCEQIRADDWSAILAECRARNIGYLIWHDRQFAEHGGFYAAKWRLGRFELLANPDTVAGVEVVRGFQGDPKVLILRLTP